MTKALTRAQVQELAEDLRALLDKIEVSDLDATAGIRNRIEGAIAVLDVVQGHVAQFDTGSEAECR